MCGVVTDPDTGEFLTDGVVTLSGESREVVVPDDLFGVVLTGDVREDLGGITRGDE